MNLKSIILLFSLAFVQSGVAMDKQPVPLLENGVTQAQTILPRQFTQAELAEYEAQRKAKAQAALANRLQEQAHQTRADAALAQQLSDQENGQLQRQLPTAAQDADAKRVVAKKSADQELKEACEILFELSQKNVDCFNGQGLPKDLQKLVFDKVQEMQDYRVLTHDEYIHIRKVEPFADVRGNLRIISTDNQCSIYLHDVAENSSKRVSNNRSNEWCLSAVSLVDRFNNWYLISGHATKDPLSIKTLQMRDGNSGQVVYSIACDYCPETILAYEDCNGNLRLIIRSYTSLRSVDGMTGKELARSEDFTERIMGFALSQDMSLIIAGCSDNKIRIFDSNTCVLLQVLDGHKSSVDAVSICTDSKGVSYILAILRDNTVCLWNGTTGRLIRKFANRFTMGDPFLYIDAKDVVYLISRSSHYHINIHNAITGEFLLQVDNGPEVKDFKVLTQKNGNWYLVAGLSCGEILVWDIEKALTDGYTVFNRGNRDLLRVCFQQSTAAGNLEHIATHIDRDGNWYLITSSSTTIKIWKFGPGQFEQTLIDQNNFEKARSILQELPNPQGGNGLPLPLQRLVAEYINIW